MRFLDIDLVESLSHSGRGYIKTKLHNVVAPTFFLSSRCGGREREKIKFTSTINGKYILLRSSGHFCPDCDIYKIDLNKVNIYKDKIGIRYSFILKQKNTFLILKGLPVYGGYTLKIT